MRNKITLLALFFFFLNKFYGAAAPDNLLKNNGDFALCDSVFLSAGEFSSADRPNPILHMFRAKQKKKKQGLAALLAFPLPFGIVGLHRIYLGCAPYVPVVYIATLGGMFGVLPFIDFWVLLLNKDTDHYSDNKKIFMWVN